MENSVEYVDFNGTSIPCILEGGQILVVIKPIIDDLGVYADSAYSRIKNDSILGDVVAVRQVHDASNRRQEMVTLPAQYVHGWLFSIDANKVNPEVKPKLLLYKKQCYDILFGHFFGKHQEIERNLLELRKMQARSYEIDQQIKTLQKEKKDLRKAMEKLHSENFNQLRLELEGGEQ